MNDNAKAILRSWLYNILARLETEDIIEASRSTSGSNEEINITWE